MCEAGAWKSFDDIEDNLTLDELMNLFDKTGERQRRLLDVVVAAFGGTPSSAQSAEPVTSDIIADDGSHLFSYDQQEEL